ncbi:MAG TPA: TIGR01777 family oxidoreductase [Myxococcota bacterium]
MPVFERETPLPATAADVFAYHATTGAFSRLSPPFDTNRIVTPLPSLSEGAVAEFDVVIGPASVRWRAKHHGVRDGSDGGDAGFVDTMERGPFSSWRHEHIFRHVDDAHSVLVDRISWEALPGAGLVVPQRLERMFAYRHAVTRDDLQLRRDLGAPQPLVIGVTGASGLIGRELTALLRVLGHDVRAFHRLDPKHPGNKAPKGTIGWTPSTGEVDVDAASALDAVVHLAGENIGEGRLDDAKKKRLYEQRVEQTKKLLASLAKLPAPPKVVVGASAVGFYGDRGDEHLDEDSAPGEGFLPRFCVDWQNAVLSPGPWRAVTTRIGLVLSPAGGALGKVLPLFKAGLGGPLGDGTSWMPTIGVDDVADVIARAVFDERVVGVVNACGPTPLRNSAYTKMLGHVLHRPAVLPVPRFALKVALGDFGDNVLDSARATSKRLVEVGHRFRHVDAEHAVRHLLGEHDR